MLAIAGGKGGCGKTTTALGLAAALARDGAAPVVADADRDAPDLGLLADATPSSDATAQAADRPLQSIARESTTFPDVSVVPAPASLSDGDFHAALVRFAADDRPVICDCPAGASRDAVVPLRASDEVLLAATLAPASLRDAAKTAAMADRLGVDVAGTVLTRVPAWATRNEGGADSVGNPVRQGIVRRVERLVDAPVVGGVPAVDRTGRAVLGHPVVRASYDRLATALGR